MSTDIFANFSVLDEVIQVVYQSIYKFVVLSIVKDDCWVMYLGLSDSGRWWKGSWTEADVHEALVRLWYAAAYIRYLTVGTRAPRRRIESSSSLQSSWRNCS